MTTNRKARRAAVNEAPPEPPTTAELYLRAKRSSHLELGEKRGAADRLIAAGLSSGGPGDPPHMRLGMLLYALIGEWQENDRTLKVSDARRGKPEKARNLMTYMDMGSLREIRAALMDYGTTLAIKRGFEIDDAAMGAIVGRCIETFLSPLCGTCHGTGVTGTYGGPQPPCRDCSGSGKHKVGQGISEQAFAGGLLRDMEAFATEAERHCRLNQRAVDQAKALIIEEARNA